MLPKELIKVLLKEQQPFILMQGKSSFASYQVPFYELVIWQSVERGLEILTMSRKEFKEYISKYNLKLLQENSEGKIYGLDHRLRDLWGEYKAELGDIEDRIYQKYLLHLRRGGRDPDVTASLKELHRQKREIEQAFMQKHRIMKFKFSEGGRSKKEN